MRCAHSQLQAALLATVALMNHEDYHSQVHNAAMLCVCVAVAEQCMDVGMRFAKLLKAS